MAYNGYNFSCKGCEKRVLGCHSVCKDYIDNKKRGEEEIRRIQELKRRESDLTSFFRGGVEKYLRNH